MRSRTFIATPPGATIREQLIDRGMNQKEFALRMDMSEKHISRLINGEVRLTPDVAVRLEMVLGVPARFWSNLEAIYREKLEKVRVENAMDSDIEVARLLPYNEMAKLTWVPETNNQTEKVEYLRKYFGVVELSLLDNTQITKIACRRLAITEKSDLALLAWAQEIKILSRGIKTEPVNIKGLIDNMQMVKRMTRLQEGEFCPKLQHILSQYGIALIILPHLRGSFLQGASFMEGNKIVVGLTTRRKTSDIFWFSLFHEFGHIVLGHIGKPDGTTKKDEDDADQWAQNTLIAPDRYEEFKRGTISSESICTFAEDNGIAPGIVVGRLQRDKCIKYNQYNELKEQYDFQV